jgi:CHAT domain-containing protein
MKTLPHQIALFIVFSLFSITVAANEVENETSGEAFFNEGQFEDAVQAWHKRLSTPPCQKECQIDTSVRLSAAYVSLSHLQQAFNVLESVQQILDDNDLEYKATVQMYLSDVYFAMRDFQDKDMTGGWEKIRQTILPSVNGEKQKKIIITKDKILKKAEELLNKAKAVFPAMKPLLLANIHNRQGHVYFAQKKYHEALEAYEKALNLAAQKNDQLLTAKILVNILEVADQSCESKHIKDELKSETALKRVKALTNSYDKAFALINLGKVMLSTFKRHKQPKLRQSDDCEFSAYQLDKKELKALYWYAYQAFTAAREIAIKIDNNRALAYSDFYLAQVYAEQPRYSEIAIQLTREAIRYIESKAMYLQRGNEQWIRDADHIGPKGFHFYLSSLKDDEPEHCREKCQKNEDLPKKCFGSCQKNRSALFLQNYYPELLFRLKRQLGDLLNTQSQTKPQLVIDTYNEAAKYLQQVRQNYRCGSSKLGKEGEVFFSNMLNFLLISAKKEFNSTEKQKLLTKAIDTIESLREIELQNYFKDVCLRGEEKKRLDEQLPEKTALFYPNVFTDRIELLLLSFEDHTIKQFEPPKINGEIINGEKFTDKANSFFTQVSDDELVNNNNYIHSAQLLYRWLIEPIEPHLKNKNIKTLIIVPDSQLFNFPFAALHDVKEKKYFFQKYAHAILPAWKLTNMEAMSRDKISALLMGLEKSQAEEAKQFEELNHFDDEVKKITKTFNSISFLQKNHKLLIKEDFTVQNVETWLTKNSYSIVHFTTHGHFDPNHENTFLLAFDELLKLDKLKILFNSPTFREQPVELLTLSACESALGGANKGLAGVALQTGARSALATLWKVNENSTADLMDKFYEQFITKQLSKAQALQEAQKELFKYGHSHPPYYWAPFIIIGNWK